LTMGSGASALMYDVDEARGIFMPPSEVAAAARSTLASGGLDVRATLEDLEAAARVSSYCFPRDGLVFAVSAREVQRAEEDGTMLVDAVGGQVVSTPSAAVPDELGVRAWEQAVSIGGGGVGLGGDYTVALWVRLSEAVPTGVVTMVGSSATAAPLLALLDRGLTAKTPGVDDTGLTIGLASHFEGGKVDRDRWHLVILQGSPSLIEMFIASDERMVCRAGGGAVKPARNSGGCAVDSFGGQGKMHPKRNHTLLINTLQTTV